MRYIYGLVDPRDKRIKYVGQTNDLNRRYEEHCETVETTTKAAWIQELRLVDTKPLMIILDECNGKESDYLENWWIVLGRQQGWRLENGTHPTVKRFGKDFPSLFADYLMEMYAHHIEARHELNRDTIRGEVNLIKAFFCFLIISLGSLFTFIDAFAGGVVTHNFSIFSIAAPVLAFVVGVQMLRGWFKDQKTRKQEDYKTLLKDGAFYAMMVSFLVVGLFSLIEIGKMMN